MSGGRYGSHVYDFLQFPFLEKRKECSSDMVHTEHVGGEVLVQVIPTVVSIK